MPSSKNYKRDYKQEAATESPERKKFRDMRMAARRAFDKSYAAAHNGGHIPEGYDVDHIDPLSLGGKSVPSNERIIPSHNNRSYARTSSGKIKKSAYKVK